MLRSVNVTAGADECATLRTETTCSRNQNSPTEAGSQRCRAGTPCKPCQQNEELSFTAWTDMGHMHHHCAVLGPLLQDEPPGLTSVHNSTYARSTLTQDVQQSSIAATSTFSVSVGIKQETGPDQVHSLIARRDAGGNATGHAL